MKLENLDRVKKSGERLKKLEDTLAYFERAQTLEVSGRDGCYRLELGDYPPPSELGRAFAHVKVAMVAYHQAAVESQRAELVSLGVEL